MKGTIGSGGSFFILQPRGYSVIRNSNVQVGTIVAGSILLASCSTLTAPFKDADPRWADYKSWTKLTEEVEPTGDPTGFLGNVHMGREGYREVYVNDIGRDALLGSAPYNFPAGTVVVKEQYASKADWEADRKAAHTISVKVAAGDEVSRDNWIWSDSYKGTAGESAFCAGCHTIAAGSDYVFTTGDFIRNLE